MWKRKGTVKPAASLLAVGLLAGIAAAKTPRLGVCTAGQPQSDIRAESLADLLSVALSQDSSIELVEREQMRAILREVRLAALVGAKGRQDRLKVGRQVQADFLAWVAVVDARPAGRPARPAEFVRLVISDCTYGARLRVEYFPFRSDQLSQACERCTTVVRQTLDDYKRGVRYLVGVPPFVSGNLSSANHGLQESFAYLLQSAVLRTPGVAVLEMNEAQAIADELQRAGRDVEPPAMPLFVRGEFETTGQGPETSVRLRIALQDGIGTPRVVERQMPLGDVPDFLRLHVVGGLLPLSGRDLHAPTRDEQLRWITERAETFSRLGSFEQAIALREAALLLNPDDADGRLALLAECHQQYLSGRWQTPVRIALGGQSPEAVQQRLKQVHQELWERRMQHVEYLLRHRQVNPREAGYLIASTTDYWLHMRQLGHRIFKPTPCPDEQPQAQAFFWRNVPLISRLDYETAQGVIRRGFEFYFEYRRAQEIEWQPASQDAAWLTATARSLLDFQWHTKPSAELEPRVLDQLYRLLTEVAPREAFPESHLFRPGEDNCRSARQFYQRLIDSGHAGAAFYGRYRLLRWGVLSDDDPARRIARLAEAQSLIEELKKFPPSKRADVYLGSLRGLARKLENRMKGIPDPAPSRVVRREEENGADRHHRVSFEPLPHITATWSRLVNCSGRFDLVWGDDSVAVLGNDGTVRPIYKPRQNHHDAPAVVQCQWDGRLIWVATNDGGRILALEQSGAVAARFGSAEGLPPSAPYSRANPLYPPLQIRALGPGRLLAVGRFGQLGRGWFAELKATPSGPRVHVFHKLTKLPRQGTDQGDDPEFIAPIAALIEWPGPQPGRRRLLAVRAPDRGLGYGRPPLVIALPTLETSLANVPFPMPYLNAYRHDTTVRILDNGEVLEAVSAGIAAFNIAIGRSPGGTRHLLFETHTPSRRPHLLEYQGDLLYAGRHWYRIEPRSMRVEPLTDGPLPAKFDFQRYAVSSHFGLVAWNLHEPPYRVRLDPGPDKR